MVYKELTFEHLEAIVDTMVTFARSQPPFDSVKAAAEVAVKAETDSTLRVNDFGDGVVQTVSKSPLDFLAYTRFVKMQHHDLQLSYYEMSRPTLGRIGQLTVVDGLKYPLEPDLKIGLVGMFFRDDWRAAQIINGTPAHVLVAVKLVEVIVP